MTSELFGSDGQPRPLRAQSAQVLAVLAAHPNEVVSKEDLFEAVWQDLSVTDDSLTQCIGDIRKAIGDTDRTILRAIPKKGYQLIAVRTLSLNGDGVPFQGRGRLWTAVGGVVAFALIVVVLLGVWRMQQADQAVQSSGPKASITVLPFADLSPDRDLGHFADGMTEDLITDLARWKEFQVTARNSAMTYKDQPIDVRQVAQDMNTRYVLQGSVRRFGDEMRITAQLIDGETGNHVWAERFEETDDDVLALQDSVIGRIVQSLIGNHGVVREDEYAKTWARAEADLDEYDYYLRGHALFYRFTPEDNEKAIEIWKEGLARHPDSGLLKIKLGWGHLAELIWYSTDTPHTLETVHDLVRQGMSDPSLPPAGHRFGLWLLAEVQAQMGDRSGVVETVQDVVDAYPFDTEGLMIMVGPTTAVGDYAFAEELASRASGLGYRLDPPDYTDVGTLRYAQGDCARAIPLLEKALMTDVATLLLAGCYAEVDRVGDAQRLLAKSSADHGIIAPEDFPAEFRSTPGVAERLTAQLAKVGWPAPPRENPSIIVLPFRDLSPDTSLAHFADGMTEDLITGLSRWRDFQVVDRMTAMSFRDSGLSIAEIAGRTQSQYALEGSIRRLGDVIRITAQLVDAETGRNVWAQRYDETEADILAMHNGIFDRIERSLIGTMGVVHTAEFRKSWARSPMRLDEYDYVLRGHSLFYEFTPDDMVHALQIWDEGQDRFPDSSYLKIKRAWGQYLCNVLYCSEGPFDYKGIADLLEEGLADPMLLAMGKRHGSWLRIALAAVRGDADTASQTAIELAALYPSDVEGLLLAAQYTARAGAVGTAQKMVELAGPLKQRPMPYFYFDAAFVHFILDDCEAARPFLSAGPFPADGLMRAACYIEFGEIDRARRELDRVREKFGLRNLDTPLLDFLYLPDVQARLEATLAQVGWPE
ncbi:winged helix-turn-helix domain-containing protein [Roseivivax lentus]|uniref:winged helix-turn-helix domain-containing protein n=1 Tax=Roseivivax lentus TaxID=633194 RepID=UPI0013563976|nr:winged helix-turn-helix domain-containing protein [Roseivivax lentus]